MKSALRTALIIYLTVLLLLAFLPLTGYYAAALALPVMAVYLYRRYIVEQATENSVVSRGIFLFAAIVFLCGFALNMFCTLYTTYRMAEFRQKVEQSKKKIYSELKGEQNP
jgi:predicted membrane protein